MTFPITFGQVAGLLAVGVTILALAAFGVRDFLRDGRWWLVLLAGAVIVFGLVYDASLGRAQTLGPGDFGYRHDLHHDWYKDLKQPGTGYSCCNGTTPDQPGDCRPTKAYKVGDRWRALLDGQWVDVPPNVLISADQSHEPYQFHICASRSGLIYCAIEKQGGG